MRVAILGTGKMGGAMARRLGSMGHQLTLWNRTRQRAEALGVGVVTATPAEAADKAEVVLSILTNADAVRAAYLGKDGAAKAPHGQVFVEMSTAGPDIARELASLIEPAGAQFVEAPVLGSIGAVASGTLVISRLAARRPSRAPAPCSRTSARSAARVKWAAPPP